MNRLFLNSQLAKNDRAVPFDESAIDKTSDRTL